MTATALALVWLALVIGALSRGRPRPARLPGGPLAGERCAHPPARRRLPTWTGPTSRRTMARRAEAAAAGVPDLVDLFAVAVGAGCTVHLAVAAVVRRAPPGPLVDELRRALADVRSGARLADALEAIPERTVEAVRPLVHVLVDAARYGTALGPSLDRVADEARRSRHRRAEEAARRVPVKLLFPLVTCVLPAFALLTLAPLIAGGLRSLRP